MPTIGKPNLGKEGERKAPQIRGGKMYFYHPPCPILSQPLLLKKGTGKRSAKTNKLIIS